MDINIAVAVIAGCSAIGGSVVTIIGNWVQNSNQKKREDSIMRKKEEAEIYRDFILKLQHFMNNKRDSSAFLEFQGAIDLLFITADKTVATVALDYFNEMVTVISEWGTMENSAHEFYQQKLINTMRKRILGDQQDLDNVRIIAFEA